MTTIRYLTAAQWGMTWSRPPVAERLLDGETFIHHVGGGAWMDQSAEVTFRNLNTFAQVTKGYSALDYDVMVHYHRATDVLTIAEGRGKWMSAATKDRNEQGEAVCVCGNFTLREPLPIEVQGAALGVVYGVQNGWIARHTTILGHRDNPAHPGATGCPGDHMYAKLPTIRGMVSAILFPPVITPPSDQETDDMATVIINDEQDNGKYWYYDQFVRREFTYPGNDLALIAKLWEAEDQGVRFKGHTPVKDNRAIPVPFPLTDFQRADFKSAKDLTVR